MSDPQASTGSAENPPYSADGGLGGSSTRGADTTATAACGTATCGTELHDALYVHVPFCVVKCTYCDFYSLPDRGQDVEGTLDLLLAELEARTRAEGRALEPRTVFFGGGTPSLLSTAQLRRLLDGVDAHTNFRASAHEVTLECNPESLELEKARAMRELGVTRVSIGVQSLRPETLRLFDRPHSVDEAFRAYEAARAAEIGQVSLDLIYGAPAETLDGWEADLRRLLALEPDHVSAYELTLEQDTPLQRDAELGRIQPIDEEQGLALFWRTRELGAEHGYHAYEISNFARVVPRADAPLGPRPESRCRHNLNYWANGPYLGIGPAAVSKRGHLRRGNPRNLGTWAAQVRDLVAGDASPDVPWVQRSGRGGRPLDPSQAWSEELAPLARLGETWWLGLRTARGVDPARARRTAGWDADARDPARERAEELAREGLIERRGERFRLTPAGLPLADAVAARFLDLPGQEQSGQTAD